MGTALLSRGSRPAPPARQLGICCSSPHQERRPSHSSRSLSGPASGRGGSSLKVVPPVRPGRHRGSLRTWCRPSLASSGGRAAKGGASPTATGGSREAGRLAGRQARRECSARAHWRTRPLGAQRGLVKVRDLDWRDGEDWRLAPFHRLPVHRAPAGSRVGDGWQAGMGWMRAERNSLSRRAVGKNQSSGSRGGGSGLSPPAPAALPAGWPARSTGRSWPPAPHPPCCCPQSTGRGAAGR